MPDSYDSAVLDVLIELKEEGLETARLVEDQLRDLNEEVKDLNRSLEKMSDRAHEDALAMLELAGATNVASGATGGAGLFSFINNLAMLMPGGTVMGYAIVGVLGLSIALAPLAALLVAATVLLGAFTVGVATLATVLTLGLLPMLALAGAVAYLAIQAQGGVDANKALETTHAAVLKQTKQHALAVQDLSAAQAKYDSLHSAANAEALFIANQRVIATAAMLQTALDDQHAAAVGMSSAVSGISAAFGDMVDEWTVQAIPIAYQVITAFQNMLPAIADAGSALLAWFDQRLPAVIPLVQGMLGTIGTLILGVGTAIGHVTDFMIANGPALQNFFKGIGDVGGRAIIGLVDNLLRMSDWFLQRLPQLAPIAASILGGLGNVIQGVGTVTGHVIDFFIKNWPLIAKGAQETAEVFKAAWNNPLVQEGLKQIGRLLKDVGDHLYMLKPLLPIVGAAFVAMVLVMMGSLGGLLILAATLERIVAAGQWIADRFTGSASGVPVAGGGTGAHGGHGGATGPSRPSTSGSSGVGLSPSVTVLPMLFSPIPPNQQQVAAMSDAIRRLNLAQT